MSNSYQALFYPLKTGRLSAPQAGASILFMNAVVCAELDDFCAENVTLYQSFKPFADGLALHEAEVHSKIPNGRFDYIFLCVPKNRIETQYLMAQACKRLNNGGVLICAGANDAGGNRLGKLMQELGFIEAREESKYKARAVWGIKPKEFCRNIIDEWLENGAPQDILEGKFVSQPGVYGWNKIDRGSDILVQFLPDGLKGRIADFGCGYGFLSDHLLVHNPDISALYCIDADARAVEICQKNMARYSDHQAEIHYMWEDLMQKPEGLKGLDYIVMNPPFHEGKRANFEIGQSFIKTAAAALRLRGKLFMVANRKLPYESVLKESFSKVEMLHEAQGFKVFASVK